MAMCSLSVSQPGSNFSIGPLPFSSFPVFSVEDELESSASAADAAGEADAAWGDAAWGDAAGAADAAGEADGAADEAWGDAAGAAEPSSSSSEDAASLLDAPASALAPLLPDDVSSDAGLLDASALTGGESETASGEGGRSRMIQRCSPRPPPTIPCRQTRSCPPATTPDPELASAHAALQHSSSHGPSSRSLGPTLET